MAKSFNINEFKYFLKYVNDIDKSYYFDQKEYFRLAAKKNYEKNKDRLKEIKLKHIQSKKVKCDLCNKYVFTTHFKTKKHSLKTI